MSRSHPWISRCPEPVRDLIQQLSSTRLYLVRETGPTSFILTDGEGQSDVAASTTTTTSSRGPQANKYKVRIGSTHKCSCGSSQATCIHILYVFCKIFRVPDTNPLIWQQSLIDHEINQILQGRASAAYARVNGTRGVTGGGSGTSKTKRRLQLEEGDVCPICQDDMNQDDFLIYCHECGQNIHTKCMKIWADHRTKCHEEITCPLCRTNWSLAQVQELSYVNRKRYVTSTAHTGVKCDACSAIPIQGERFKCTICADYNLCSDCFHYKSIHTQHSFDKKDNPKEEVWVPVDRVISIDRRVGGSSTLSSGIQGLSSTRRTAGGSSTTTGSSSTSRTRRRGSTSTQTQRSHSTRRERPARGASPGLGGALDLAVVATRHNAPTTTTRDPLILGTADEVHEPQSMQHQRHRRRPRSNSTGAIRSSSQTSIAPPQPVTVTPSILDLQHRDIDPNDYELLLQLDAPQDRGIPKYIFSLLPQVHVNEHNYSDFSDDTCSICLCNYQISDDLCHLKCLHYYHYACISKWLESHDSCCVCNHQVTAEDYPPPSHIQITRERTDRELSEQLQNAYSASPTTRPPPNRPRPLSVIRTQTSGASTSRSTTPTSSSTQSSGSDLDLNFGITGSTWDNGRALNAGPSSASSTPQRPARRAPSQSTPQTRTASRQASQPSTPFQSDMSGLGIGITGSTAGGNRSNTTGSRPLIRSESLRRMKRTAQRKKTLESQSASTGEEQGGTLSEANDQHFTSMFNVRSTRQGQVQQSSHQERQKVRSVPRVKVGKKQLANTVPNPSPDSATALSTFSLAGRRI